MKNSNKKNKRANTDSTKSATLNFIYLLALLSLCAVFVVFGQIIWTHGFVFDDEYLIVKNPYLGSWKNLALFFTKDVTLMSGIQAPSGYYRPLSMVILQVLFHFFGLAAWKYHLFSLLVHAGNAFLTGFLIWQLSQRKALAFLSALIFAIHPAHVESFAPIYNYMGLLASGFALLSIIAFVQGRQTAFSPWFIFSVQMYACAIFCKEDTLVLPLLLPILDRIWFQKEKHKLNVKMLSDLAPYGTLAAVYLIARVLFVDSGAALGFWKNSIQLNVYHPGGLEGWIASIFLTLKSYLFLWIWPVKLTIYHILNLPAHVLGWVAFLFQCLLFLILTFVFGRNRFVLCGVAWFIVFSLLICNFIPFGGLFAERLIYLPSVGLTWITAVLLDRMRQVFSRSQFGKIFFAGLLTLGLGFFAYGAHAYAQVWQSNFSIWKHARQLEPNRPYPWMQLAKAFYDTGDFRAAALHYKEAADLDDNAVEAAASLWKAARSWGEAGEYERSVREYKALLARQPRNWNGWFELGWTYFLSEDDQSAETTFKQTLVKHPDDPWSYYGLAELAFKKGDDEKGRNLYTFALNHSDDPVLMQTILKNLKNRSKQ